jgi:hypothetical protein
MERLISFATKSSLTPRARLDLIKSTRLVRIFHVSSKQSIFARDIFLQIHVDVVFVRN